MAIERWRPASTLRRRPFGGLNRLEQEMQETFDRWFHRWPWPFGDADSLGQVPPVDVVDRKEEVVLRADLPGLTEKDIELTLENGNLTIRGERNEEEEAKEEDYYCSERWLGAFSRSLTLPTGVDADKIRATFREGVLEVHLPKTAKAEGKKIEIKAAA